LQRKSRQAAQHQPNDEDREPDADFSDLSGGFAFQLPSSFPKEFIACPTIAAVVSGASDSGAMARSIVGNEWSSAHRCRESIFLSSARSHYIPVSGGK
jgi:hypothetical protein